MIRLVGLTGVAGSGKDTAADRLVEHGFVKVSLADGMKRICADVFGFSHEQLWGPSARRNAPDPRYPRQHYASTPMGRCDCCGADVELEGETTCYLTPRHALQQLGTEWGRACFEDVWIQHAIRTARALLGKHDLGCFRYDRCQGLVPTLSTRPPAGVVIPDVRFDNEAAAINAAGGRVLAIERHGAGLRGAAGQHASERGVSTPLLWGYLLNNGTIADLHALVDELVEKLTEAA